jgi:hypothetical protein
MYLTNEKIFIKKICSLGYTKMIKDKSINPSMVVSNIYKKVDFIIFV